MANIQKQVAKISPEVEDKLIALKSLSVIKETPTTASIEIAKVAKEAIGAIIDISSSVNHVKYCGRTIIDIIASQ